MLELIGFNKLKRIISVVLILFAVNTFADQKENEILKRRASSYRANKQYEKAISLYETILKNDPDDVENIHALIIILLQTSKIEQAEKLLNTHKKKIPESLHFQLELMILLHKAEFDKAQNISNKFLDKQRGNITNYGTVAKVFEQYRQYETAIEIYLKARKIAGDDNLYVRELANDYHALKDHENSVREFVRLVENRNLYAAFVLSRFKSMLSEETSVIRFIKETAGTSENPAIREIYALCLGETGEYEKAIKEYEYLPTENILKFADRMEKNRRLDIAVRAYNIFLSRSINVVEKAKTKIILANIYIKQNELTKAEEILIELYQDTELRSRSNKYKTRANRQCRELLAQIYLRRNASQKEVIQYLEEAKEFAFNKNEINEVEFKIIHLLIMNEENDLAREKLKNILNKENTGSDIFKKGYYYSFLLSVMTNDAESDSLLGELLINIPQDDMTNDALLLFQNTGLFSNKADREDFLKAYRKKSIYNNKKAIEMLQSIYEKSKLEEILFLTGEWAMQTGNVKLAEEIFSHDFSKQDLQQFAILKLSEIENDKTEKKNYSRDFLQNNPQSVFSPQFRRILGN